MEIEAEEDTLDGAVEKVLEEFGCTRAEVEVEILQTPSSGLLGVIGRRPARVLVRLTDRGYIARRIGQELLRRAGLSGTVQVAQGSERVDLEIVGQETRQAIGRRGQCLDALQYLIIALTDRLCDDRTPIYLDAGGYRQHRIAYLNRLARRLSFQVRKSGRPATLQPLPPQERRIVHLALQGDEEVESRSVGQGFERKMIISPRRG